MTKPTLADAWVQQVERCALTDLPDYVRRGVLSCGADAGPLLVEMLGEPDCWENRLAEHAIVLLGQLRYEPALPDLADLLWDEPEYLPEVSVALISFGDLAIPALVAQLRAGQPEGLPILVKLSARKNRPDVREAFEHALASDPSSVVHALESLEDPGLLPAMYTAFEQLKRTRPRHRRTIARLGEAIAFLGGEPGDQRQ